MVGHSVRLQHLVQFASVTDNVTCDHRHTGAELDDPVFGVIVTPSSGS